MRGGSDRKAGKGDVTTSFVGGEAVFLGCDAGSGSCQPCVEVDLFAGEEEALDAVEVADADLGMGFGLDVGAFEGGAAFGEGAAGGVEGFCF